MAGMASAAAVTAVTATSSDVDLVTWKWQYGTDGEEAVVVVVVMDIKWLHGMHLLPIGPGNSWGVTSGETVPSISSTPSNPLQAPH